MERKLVSSSNLHSVGYDSVSGTLEIKFIKSGVYQYFNVPSTIYDGLLAAYSKGGYFDDRIKECFRFKKTSNA